MHNIMIIIIILRAVQKTQHRAVKCDDSAFAALSRRSVFVLRP